MFENYKYRYGNGRRFNNQVVIMFIVLGIVKNYVIFKKRIKIVLKIFYFQKLSVF